MSCMSGRGSTSFRDAKTTCLWLTCGGGRVYDSKAASRKKESPSRQAGMASRRFVPRWADDAFWPAPDWSRPGLAVVVVLESGADWADAAAAADEAGCSVVGVGGSTTMVSTVLVPVSVGAVVSWGVSSTPVMPWGRDTGLASGVCLSAVRERRRLGALARVLGGITMTYASELAGKRKARKRGEQGERASAWRSKNGDNAHERKTNYPATTRRARCAG